MPDLAAWASCTTETVLKAIRRIYALSVRDRFRRRPTRYEWKEVRRMKIKTQVKSGGVLIGD